MSSNASSPHITIRNTPRMRTQGLCILLVSHDAGGGEVSSRHPRADQIRNLPHVREAQYKAIGKRA